MSEQLVPCPREDDKGNRIPCPYNSWDINYEWRARSDNYAVVQTCTLCGRKMVQSYTSEAPETD